MYSTGCRDLKVYRDDLLKRPLQLHFLAIDLPLLPPITLVAYWSVKSQPSLPRRPRRSTALYISTALAEGQVSSSSLMVACLRLRGGCDWSLLVGTSGTQYMSGEYALVSKNRLCRVPEASPLDDAIRT